MLLIVTLIVLYPNVEMDMRIMKRVKPVMMATELTPMLVLMATVDHV
jgi:hypothetical protein